MRACRVLAAVLFTAVVSAVAPLPAQAPRAPVVVAVTVGAAAGAIDGQGLTRAAGADCMILTPRHVVERMLDTAGIVLSQAVRGQATLHRDSPLDLVVLKVAAESPLRCSAWTPDSSLRDVLELATEGVLASRDFGGGRSNMPVTIRSYDDIGIVVQPKSAQDAISRGMSGSLLLVGGVPVGMLYEVDPASGGRAYRLDYVERIVGPVFAAAGPARPEVDPRAALAILDRALERRDGSQLMQVPALEELLRLGNKFNGSDFSGVLLAGARLSGGTLTNSRFTLTDLGGVSAQRADFSGSTLMFTSADRANFDSAVVVATRAPFMQASASSWRKANLSGSDFFGANLRGADFRGADLRGTSLSFSDLTGARFDGADLRGAFLVSSRVDSASFTGAQFGETSVLGSSFGSVVLTAPQQAGVCRHGKFRPEGEGIEVSLYAADDESRRQSRRLEDGIYDFGWRFPGMGDRSLRPCTQPERNAAGYSPEYRQGGSFGINRKLLQVESRRADVSRRVQMHFDSLALHLKRGYYMRDSSVLQSWVRDLTSRARAARGFGPVPELNHLSAAAVLIGSGAWRPDSGAWETIARDRWWHDVGFALRERRTDSLQAPGLFYPPGATWNELPPVERVSLYREFVTRQAATPVRTFECRALGAYYAALRDDKPSGRDSVWMAVDFRFCGGLGYTQYSNDVSWPWPGTHELGSHLGTSTAVHPFEQPWYKAYAKLEPTLRTAGYDMKHLAPIGFEVYGIDWVLLALPDAERDYGMYLPDTVEMGYVKVQVGLDLRRVQLLRGPDNVRIAVMTVTPRTAHAELAGAPDRVPIRSRPTPSDDR